MAKQRRALLWWLAVTTVLAAAFAGVPAVAAGASVEIVGVGWDGQVVMGAWAPVRVKVTGGSTDATALVEVTLRNRHQAGPQGQMVEYPISSYAQEVSLPAGVTKEVVVWTPVEGAQGGFVRLLLDGRPEARAPLPDLQLRSEVSPLIGVMADSPLLSRLVSQIEVPYQGLPTPVRPARLAHHDLPSQGQYLNALAALVMQGPDVVNLTGEQRAALRSWVADGGHLVLVSGPDGGRITDALPDGSLPLSFAGTVSAADLAPLARWAGQGPTSPGSGPAARWRPTGGSVLAGTPDLPLAWRTEMGKGSVAVLAFDPTLVPLSTWSGTQEVLRRALEPALPKPGEDEKMRYVSSQWQRENPMRLQSATGALSADVYPGWREIGLLLGGLAFLAGPALHIALWRLDRRGWTWVLVPALAVTLTAGLYAIGVAREGRDVLAQVVAHVKLDATGGMAKQTLAAGFYAPTKAHLVVDVPGDAVPRADANAQGPYYSGPKYAGPWGWFPMVSEDGEAAGEEYGAPYRVVGGRATRVEFNTGQWQMRTVYLTREVEVGEGIHARLGVEDGLIKGVVRNDTPYRLEDAAVILGQELVKLGSLAPGQSAPVVLAPPPAWNPFVGGQPISYRLFGRPLEVGGSGGAPMPAPAPAARSMVVPSGSVKMPYPPYFEPLQLPNDAETTRRVRLLDAAVSAPLQPGMHFAALPLSFVAFTTEPLGLDTPTAGKHPIHHLTLFEQPLRLHFDPGGFVLPPAVIPFTVSEQDARGLGTSGDGTNFWMELYGGSVVYSYRPPLPSGASVDALRITTRQVGPMVTMASMVDSRVQPAPFDPTPRPAEAGVFQIYNWREATWEELPVGGESALVRPADAYVSGDGETRVKVAAHPDHQLRFLAPELTVEGRMEE